jgi:hypothetical protein
MPHQAVAAIALLAHQGKPPAGPWEGSSTVRGATPAKVQFRSRGTEKDLLSAETLDANGTNLTQLYHRSAPLSLAHM